MLQGIILTQLLTHDQVSLTLGQAALSLSVMALKKKMCAFRMPQSSLYTLCPLKPKATREIFGQVFSPPFSRERN